MVIFPVIVNKVVAQGGKDTRCLKSGWYSRKEFAKYTVHRVKAPNPKTPKSQKGLKAQCSLQIKDARP